MLSYSNNFSISVADNNDEFVLTFKQRYPVLDDNGEPEKNVNESVASVVMTKDGAEALKELLITALGEK